MRICGRRSGPPSARLPPLQRPDPSPPPRKISRRETALPCLPKPWRVWLASSCVCSEQRIAARGAPALIVAASSETDVKDRDVRGTPLALSIASDTLRALPTTANDAWHAPRGENAPKATACSAPRFRATKRQESHRVFTTLRLARCGPAGTLSSRTSPTPRCGKAKTAQAFA
ncbi:MAG: hypothetical protein K0S81_3637 [Rhodospirillales bacterium]|nr:hypothetical protein [Rhodospirillales bacterium]